MMFTMQRARELQTAAWAAPFTEAVELSTRHIAQLPGGWTVALSLNR